MSWIQLYRHLPFLKAVFVHACTAFGGPQAHFGMLHNTFVLKRKDISATELLDYIAFCSVLPGASSTQTLTLIGYKRGGIPLAVLTLLVWVFPASLVMALLSVLYPFIEGQSGLPLLFKFIQSMAIGFVGFAAYQMFVFVVKPHSNDASKWLILGTACATLLLYNSPWVFPMMIIMGGFFSRYFSSASGVVPSTADQMVPKPVFVGSIQRKRIVSFLLIFLFVAFCSELGTQNNWKYRKQFNLFESTFRFGTLVFGGGDVLMAYMYEQYVVRPKSKKIQENKRDVLKMTHTEFLTGSGIIRAIPGPVFSIGSYVGAVLMNEQPKSLNYTVKDIDRDNMRGLNAHRAIKPFRLSSTIFQGAIIGTIGVFLPSFLLVLFFFPIWQYVKSNVFVTQALPGIFTAIVGIMVGTFCYLFKAMVITDWSNKHNTLITFIDPLIVVIVFLLLQQKLASAPKIVAFCLCAGFLLSYFL